MFFFAASGSLGIIIKGIARELLVIFDDESLSIGVGRVEIDRANRTVEFDSRKQVEVLGVGFKEGEHVRSEWK